eukprot:1109409-Rhodomonas_salina.4
MDSIESEASSAISYASAMRCPVLNVAISLGACYAMSGTDITHGSIGLGACYAMSGTDIAHVAAIISRVSYSMSGTDIAYGASAVLG